MRAPPKGEIATPPARFKLGLARGVEILSRGIGRARDHAACEHKIGPNVQRAANQSVLASAGWSHD